MHIYLDIETTRFFADPEIARRPRAEQIAALSAYFGVAWTFDDVSGWRCWWPDEVAALWRALAGHTIVGWNVIGFDVPLVKQAAARAGAPDPGLDPWFAADLFAFIRTRTGRWYKLQEVAETNLGRGKSGDGQQAAQWLRSGDPALRERAAAYCRLDVQLVLDLFGHADRAGLLLPPRTAGRISETPETFRLWLLAGPGGVWRLEDATTGQMLDEGAQWD